MVARQHDHILVQVQCFGGNSKIRGSFRHGIRKLVGCPLVHVKGDLGVAGRKALDHRRKRITGLGMGGSNIQCAHFWWVCSPATDFMLSARDKMSLAILTIDSPAGVT